MSVTEAELAQLVAIAREAGETIAGLFRQHLADPLPVQLKGPNDPVTQADELANEIICERLAQHFPDAAVVAEESAPEGAALATAVATPRVFFVDPLDGTREFVAGLDTFATMIGLVEDGRPSAGVLLLPVQRIVVAGARTVPAFVEGPDGARRPAAVSCCERFDASRMLVSRSHRPTLTERLQKKLGVASVTPCGSAGVKVARLAMAMAEHYVHDGLGMKLWDSCAPEAVLNAAGGRLTDLNGADIDYASPQLALQHGLVASNGLLHERLLQGIQALRAEST